MQEFFEDAAYQDHPLRVLRSFLAEEERLETAQQYDQMRFVGYALDISYETVTIITSDPYKVAVGGIPRNSLLIMVPDVLLRGMPPHFTVLRVLEAAPTPLSREVQQTYFELHKKSMPELDVFTQSELQWGALKTGVLGMFYPHPQLPNRVEFSGDVNNFVSAHRYKVFAPNHPITELIVNCLVPDVNRFVLGSLRLTESRLMLPGTPQPPSVEIAVSAADFMGARTALFGKTRLGKSNIVKLIAQSLIETTNASRNAGQLIFDINGEYANDNPQDDSTSLRSAYPDRSVVYALTPKPDTPSLPLKLNFYQHPDRAQRVLSDLLSGSGRTSIYISNFRSVQLPAVDEIGQLPFGDRNRATRRVLMYWAILAKAGFPAPAAMSLPVDPGFNAALRAALYPGGNAPAIRDLPSLIRELETLQDFAKANPGSALLVSSSGRPLLENDELALLEFLKPGTGAGPAVIAPFRAYHDPNAGNFSAEILARLDQGDTVILDLGNANPEVMLYFSEDLSRDVFEHQVRKFTSNALGDHYIQIYFEEAHNLFPQDEKDTIDIYLRLAKEGAKYHVGMVYATQSVTSVNRDLLAQTENFFVAHMSSVDQVNALARVNIEFETMKEDIMRTRTPGYVRMLTKSHRFVVPIQASRFAAATYRAAVNPAR